MTSEKTQFQHRLIFAQQKLSVAAEATYVVDRRAANEDATQQFVRTVAYGRSRDVG